MAHEPILDEIQECLSLMRRCKHPDFRVLTSRRIAEAWAYARTRPTLAEVGEDGVAWYNEKRVRAFADFRESLASWRHQNRLENGDPK
jgi:hypothetical protein